MCEVILLLNCKLFVKKIVEFDVDDELFDDEEVEWRFVFLLVIIYIILIV